MIRLTTSEKWSEYESEATSTRAARRGYASGNSHRVLLAFKLQRTSCEMKCKRAYGALFIPAQYSESNFLFCTYIIYGRPLLRGSLELGPRRNHHPGCSRQHPQRLRAKMRQRSTGAPSQDGTRILNCWTAEPRKSRPGWWALAEK